MTAALAVVVLLAYLAYFAAWAVPVVGDVRGAIFVIGSVGFAMCIVSGSSSAVMRQDAFLAPLTVLGIGAFLLIVVGLVSAWDLVVPVLTADILLMWAAATVRHGLGSRLSPAPMV